MGRERVKSGEKVARELIVPCASLLPPPCPLPPIVSRSPHPGSADDIPQCDVHPSVARNQSAIVRVPILQFHEHGVALRRF